MNDLSKTIFDTAVSMNRQIAHDLVTAHRAQLTHVWVIFGNGEVMGIFRSEGKAVDVMNDFADHVHVTVKRFAVGG